MDEERVFDSIKEIIVDTFNGTVTLIPYTSLAEPSHVWKVSVSKLVADDVDKLVYDTSYGRDVVRASSKWLLTCRMEGDSMFCESVPTVLLPPPRREQE